MWLSTFCCGICQSVFAVFTLHRDACDKICKTLSVVRFMWHHSVELNRYIMLGQGICEKFQSRDGISLARWATETCKLEYPHSWERRYNNNHLTNWHMSKAFYRGHFIELIKNCYLLLSCMLSILLVRFVFWHS